MAANMNKLHDMPPMHIEDLEERRPIGVIGHDGWGYVTMGPDNHPDNIPNDGWGVLPQYYWGIPSAATTPATTTLAHTTHAYHT